MMRFLIAAAAALAAVPAFAQPARPAPVDYSKASSWLCLPGNPDVCSAPLATVALNPNGYGSVGRSVVATKAPVDCFYVYPTVSRDNGLNSDLNMSEEIATASAQAARFSSVCKVYAPKYRQMTVGAIVAFTAGQDVTAAAITSYGDVVAAWRHYLARHNN